MKLNWFLKYFIIAYFITMFVIFLSLDIEKLTLNEIFYIWLKWTTVVFFAGWLLPWLRIKYDIKVGASIIDTDTQFSKKITDEEIKIKLSKSARPINSLRVKFNFITISVLLIFLSVFHKSFLLGIITIIFIFLGGYFVFFYLGKNYSN